MRGHTLVEILLVLTLIGATTASLAPTAARYRDRAAVVAAREAVVGLLAEARLAAMEAGEASVRVSGAPWVAEAIAADSTLRLVALEDEHGVSVELNGGATDVELEYGPLGIGRLANQTLAFRRGDARAELVVSGYGRVRRQ
jgi:type II secretory pathway pseudopilin PulG